MSVHVPGAGGGPSRHAAAGHGRAGAQAGSELVGGRFLCLKYCTTCWGSSASTALAKVSFAACRAESRVKRRENKGLPNGSREGRDAKGAAVDGVPRPCPRPGSHRPQGPPLREV